MLPPNDMKAMPLLAMNYKNRIDYDTEVKLLAKIVSQQ
jgi:hypothetical protein